MEVKRIFTLDWYKKYKFLLSIPGKPEYGYADTDTDTDADADALTTISVEWMCNVFE